MVKCDRKNINVATLEKVREFLKAQDTPVFKTDIMKGSNVDYNSVKLALTMLNVRANKDGKVKLK